jgi:hypothetical protein
MAGLATAVIVAATMPAASAQNCTREDFAAVVDDTAEALRVLNSKNRPEFQDRLRQLREKNRWSHDQFIAAATPFVKDETIEAYDARSEEALGRVTSMGQRGQQAKTPDCRLLGDLKGHMGSLLDIQSAKWRYMFEKIDAALAK